MNFLYKTNFENNIFEMEEILEIINKEIIYEDLFQLKDYIPMKYFFEKAKKNCIILKPYFPLINRIWEKIIIDKSVKLFNGEINDYSGKKIGNLLELNIITEISKKIKII